MSGAAGSGTIRTLQTGPPRMTTTAQIWADRASALALVIALAALPMAAIGFFAH